MPDGTSPIRQDAGSDNTERLNAAIDGMLGAGPTLVLNDPELHDLLQLATRLRDELPRDLPDPAFRLGLKQQLTTSRPVAVPRTRIVSPARFPWVAAVSAIAAVLLAAVSVGTLGIWLDNGTDNGGTFTDQTGLSGAQLTATTLGFATITAESANAVGDPTTVPGGPSSMSTIQTADTTDATASPEPTSDATETIRKTRTVESVTTPATTETVPTVPVPPVDEDTVEQGPQPAVDGGGGEPAPNVTYVLETNLPRLDNEAPVYRLVSPRVDPVSFVIDVAAQFGLAGDVISDVPQGRTVYHLFDDEGSFHWTPETGAFTLSISNASLGDAVPIEQIIKKARDWLASIGYPVERLDAATSAEPMGEKSWRLDTRYASLPEVGLGHPLGVTVFVTDDGSVTEASGYWLDVTEIDEATLVPADQIWQAVSNGDGLWTGGGIVTAGGEFRADSMTVTYVLTRDPSGDLVLQPVVQTTGLFTTADGLSSARISCFVQAARTADKNTP